MNGLGGTGFQVSEEQAKGFGGGALSQADPESTLRRAALTLDAVASSTPARTPEDQALDKFRDLAIEWQPDVKAYRQAQEERRRAAEELSRLQADPMAAAAAMTPWERAMPYFRAAATPFGPQWGARSLAAHGEAYNKAMEAHRAAMLDRAKAAYQAAKDEEAVHRQEFTQATAAARQLALAEKAERTAVKGARRMVLDKQGNVVLMDPNAPEGQQAKIVLEGELSPQLTEAALSRINKNLDNEQKELTFRTPEEMRAWRERRLKEEMDRTEQRLPGIFSRAPKTTAQAAGEVAPAATATTRPAGPAVGAEPPGTRPAGPEAVSGPRILQPGERAGIEAQEKEVGKTYGELYGKLQDLGRTADDRMAKMARLEELMKGIDTGKLTPTVTEWESIVASVPGLRGLVNFEKLGAKEAAQALSREMALMLRDPAAGAGMPGALSDRDREFLESMVPGLSTTAAGRKRIIDTMRKLAQRNKEVAKLARDYRKQHGKLDEGFEDALEALRSKSLFDRADSVTLRKGKKVWTGPADKAEELRRFGWQ